MERSVNTASKKRSLQEMQSENEETATDNQSPAKKTKLDEVPETTVVSIFEDDDDQIQFEDIFYAVENCELTKVLKIPHIISKQIAEYATGMLEECNNKHCQNVVITLWDDCEKYKPDHSNCHEFGYKDASYDIFEKSIYYCSECMDMLQTCHCNCGQLSFIPECKRCTQCKKVMFECDRCECSRKHSQCHCCGVVKCHACAQQDDDPMGQMVPCLGCYEPGHPYCTRNLYCWKCLKLPAGKNSPYGVCPNCFDESMMLKECKYCGETSSSDVIYDSEMHYIIFQRSAPYRKRHWQLYCGYKDKPRRNSNPLAHLYLG
mmetsp:Transcript_10293/g.15562  ORF Transcript_10293/g.15562 Transcript_10293/m.15562 type:complete len:318 (+) Transcript_10293:22-975(+)